MASAVPHVLWHVVGGIPKRRRALPKIVAQTSVWSLPGHWSLVSHRSARLWHGGRACGDVAYADCPFGHHHSLEESGKTAHPRGCTRPFRRLIKPHAKKVTLHI
jgi:hypothetical protein